VSAAQYANDLAPRGRSDRVDPAPRDDGGVTLGVGGGVPPDVQKRYAGALLATAFALALTAWGAGALQGSAVLLFAAVAAGGLYGGVRPGLLAGTLAAVGQALLSLGPNDGAGLDAGELLQGSVLLLLAAATGSLSDSLRSARLNSAHAAARAIASSGRLELERRRTDTVFQSMSDGVTVQDAEGRVVFANDAAAHLLGYAAGDMLAGQLAADVYAKLDPRDEEALATPPPTLPDARALAGEPSPEKLISYRLPDSGAERWALVRARAIRNEAGNVVLTVSALHDLTERIRHERALEANARDLHQLTARLEVMVEQLRIEREGALSARAEAEEALERIVTLQRVTAALSEARTPDEVGDVVLERGMEALNAQSGVLLALGSTGDQIELVRAAGVPQELVDEWIQTSPLDLSRLKNALRREELGGGGTAQVTDGNGIPTESLRKALGTDALVLVPLAARERPMGLLVFDVPGGRTLDSRDRDLLVALGRQCAQALDRARLFAAERAARDEAEQASRAKSQFLAVMSHELRTPLNAILGYEELLETEVSGPISSIQKHHLSRIRESTKHLLTLIEQILSLSRVQGGKEDLLIEEVDASALVREVANAVEPQLERKGLALQLDLPEGAIELRTDPRKVRQILFNVLSNAAKFTERGTVRVALSSADGELLYTVHDTGRGIEERDREHIFEPFVQVRGDGSMPSGAGLGLAVARELARHLGGDITLESRPGEGSAFTIRLPQRHSIPTPEPEEVGVITSLEH
jgi:PAS domain S-box-containing protein